MDLLSTHLRPLAQHIQMLIQHPSSAVRARTIALLTEWNDASITKEEFIHHPDYQTARIATGQCLEPALERIAASMRTADRALNDPSPEVSRQAIRTAEIVEMEDAIRLLDPKLPDKRLRPEAREALLKFGDRVIPELVRRLSAHDEPVSVRIRIPKALAFTGRQHAAGRLAGQPSSLRYHLDFALMQALNRMRQNWPAIAINEDRVSGAINKEHEDYVRLRSMLVWLQLNAAG